MNNITNRLLKQLTEKRIELTEKQKKIWGDLGDQLLSTTQIRHLALQYYIQYRQSLQKNKLLSEDTDKINNLIHIAYFISEKNQVTFNMRGERVIGVGFSINDIIKKNNNFQDFIFHMKEMMKIITIEDKFVEKEIESCLKKFKFTMTFHHKFVSTFKKIKPTPNQSDFSQSLLWLIFILTKQSISKQNQSDIIEVTCLIASSFIYFIEQCLKNTGKQYELDDPNYGGSLRKQSISHVFLQYFRLKDMAKFHQISTYFRNQISQIKDVTGYDYLFHEKIIENVYKKIDSIYMKKLSDQNIDQRHFLKERINTIQNGNRFTPFGGRKHVQKTNNIHIPGQILSHRVLNYEKQYEQRAKLQDYNSQQSNDTTQKNGAALLKKLAQNKTPAQKTPLIKATPMTNAMQTYNWVLQKSNYHKFQSAQLLKYLSADDRTLKLINGLWKDISMNQSDKGVQLNQRERLSILALSAQVVYFVTNSTDTIEKIINQNQISWFDIWAKIDCFLSYDMRMPISLKIHLLGLETLLISKQLWKKQQVYINIFKEQKSRLERNDFDRLYRRVIHQIVYQTYFLSKKLGFSQQTMNSIFLICQYTLQEHAQLLIHRSLYHIILCSAYAVSKAQQIELSFYSMLIEFKDINNMEKQDYHELTEQIYAQQKDNQDIITFYNGQFVKKTKNLLVQLKYQFANALNSISNRKNIISSPVKDLLPRNIVAFGDRTNTTPRTPITLALQAYHQSPLLKERKIKNIANCVDGKRILQKKHQYSKEQSLKQTSMLINQKWKNAKSPEGKINTTIKKGNENI